MMKVAMSFKGFEPPYFFHLHTNYTDGQPQVSEYYKLARERNVKQVIFLEHIRRSPDYDVEKFISEVRKETDLQVVVGFEAKILPDGTLDIAQEQFDAADIIGIAEHGFPDDVDLFIQSWEKVMAFSGYQEKSFVWVHPGLYFQKRRLLNSYWEKYLEMIDIAIEKGVFIEHNLRYNLIPPQLLDRFPNDRTVIGFDSHNAEDISKHFPRANTLMTKGEAHAT